MVDEASFCPVEHLLTLCVGTLTARVYARISSSIFNSFGESPETLSIASHNMYYELFAIVRIQDPSVIQKEASKVAATIGRLILNNRGLVRKITSLGPKPLPKVITKDTEQHFQGYNFVMAFDSSSAVQQELFRTLRRDPRILRSTITKIDMKKNLNATSSFENVFKSISIS